MDSLYPKLTVVQSNPQKILISFLYTAFKVLIGDTIDLFVEGGTEALATVKVGNPNGHWSQGSFKVGQVVLDLSAVTFHVSKQYFLYYVSQNVKGSQCALSWNSENGVLTQVKAEQEPTELLDYSDVSATTSIDTSSFECPTSSPQPSSSFFVVTESDSTPQVPEELFVIDNTLDDSDCESQTYDCKGFPQSSALSSHSNQSIPGNKESEASVWIQSSNELPTTMSNDKPEAKDTKNIEEADISSTVHNCIDCSGKHSVNVMSASVNWDDRVISQAEIQLLKSNNKDLHQKQRKLTEIMEKMQRELVFLRAKSGDSNEVTEKIRQLEQEIDQYKHQIDSLEIELAENKSQLEMTQVEIQKLKKDMKELKKKNAQLTIERNTHFERNATLLNEVQDKEKENEVLKSENMVLRGKLRRLAEKEQQEPVKQRRLSQSGYDARAPASRPLDLLLTRETKLKSPPPPHDSEPRRRHDKKPHQAPLDKPVPQQPPGSSPKQKHEIHRRENPTPIIKRPAHNNDQRASEISEQRVDGIVSSIRDTPIIVCPICQKSLSARENDYSVQLHVEQCLQKT